MYYLHDYIFSVNILWSCDTPIYNIDSYYYISAATTHKCTHTGNTGLYIISSKINIKYLKAATMLHIIIYCTNLYNLSTWLVNFFMTKI